MRYKITSKIRYVAPFLLLSFLFLLPTVFSQTSIITLNSTLQNIQYNFNFTIQDVSLWINLTTPSAVEYYQNYNYQHITIWLYPYLESIQVNPEYWKAGNLIYVLVFKVIYSPSFVIIRIPNEYANKEIYKITLVTPTRREHLIAFSNIQYMSRNILVIKLPEPATEIKIYMI